MLVRKEQGLAGARRWREDAKAKPRQQMRQSLEASWLRTQSHKIPLLKLRRTQRFGRLLRRRHHCQKRYLLRIQPKQWGRRSHLLGPQLTRLWALWWLDAALWWWLDACQ